MDPGAETVAPGPDAARSRDNADRRAMVRGLARALLSTVLVVVAYFVLPLDRLSGDAILVVLPLALCGFAVAIGFEVRAILKAEFPAVRAIEALAREVPLFLAFFAAIYFVMSTMEPGWFSENLSRLDALYFSVTIFTTVGFGDITGHAPPARVVVTIQMAADLVVIGFGLRIITHAIQRRRLATGHPPDDVA